MMKKLLATIIGLSIGLSVSAAPLSTYLSGLAKEQGDNALPSWEQVSKGIKGFKVRSSEEFGFFGFGKPVKIDGLGNIVIAYGGGRTMVNNAAFEIPVSPSMKHYPKDLDQLNDPKMKVEEIPVPCEQMSLNYTKLYALDIKGKQTLWAAVEYSSGASGEGSIVYNILNGNKETFVNFAKEKIICN